MAFSELDLLCSKVEEEDNDEESQLVGGLGPSQLLDCRSAQGISSLSINSNI